LREAIRTGWAAPAEGCQGVEASSLMAAAKSENTVFHAN